MQKGKVKPTPGPSSATLALEEETRQMENKLLLMKDFIKNIGRYKALNEREVQELIRKNVDNTAAESKQKVAVPVAAKEGRKVGKLPGMTCGAIAPATEVGRPGTSKQAPRQDAYRPSNLLKEAMMAGSDDIESAFEIKIDEIASTDKKKMAKFYAEAKIPGLQEAFEKNGVWSVADLAKVGGEFCNSLYLTAAKQDRITAAVRAVSSLDKQERHEIIIQTDDILDHDLEELKANFPRISAENESVDPEKHPLALNPTLPGVGKAMLLPKIKEPVFSDSIFDFEAIFGEALAPLASETGPIPTSNRPLPSNLSLQACQECYASFLACKTDQVDGLGFGFCDELCERKYLIKKHKSSAEAVDPLPADSPPQVIDKLSDTLSNFSEEPLTEERLLQEVAKRLQSYPEDPVDLDFDHI
jgi:hypothetical protein